MPMATASMEQTPFAIDGAMLPALVSPIFLFARLFVIIASYRRNILNTSTINLQREDSFSESQMYSESSFELTILSDCRIE